MPDRVPIASGLFAAKPPVSGRPGTGTLLLVFLTGMQQQKSCSCSGTAGET